MRRYLFIFMILLLSLIISCTPKPIDSQKDIQQSGTEIKNEKINENKDAVLKCSMENAQECLSSLKESKNVDFNTGNQTYHFRFDTNGIMHIYNNSIVGLDENNNLRCLINGKIVNSESDCLNYERIINLIDCTPNKNQYQCFTMLAYYENNASNCYNITNSSESFLCVVGLKNQRISYGIMTEKGLDIERMQVSAISELARIKNEISMCFLLKSVKDQLDCKKSIIVHMNNSNDCEQFASAIEKDHKDLCYANFATNLMDESLCTKIQNNGRKNDCYNHLANLNIKNGLCNKSKANLLCNNIIDNKKQKQYCLERTEKASC